MRGERDDGYMAQEERLGDVRLYRVPIEVTVAAHSQKQIALLSQPSVRVTSVLRYDVRLGEFGDEPLQRVLITNNEASDGLGLPLPAGEVALFGQRGNRRILIGQGRIHDYTLGEKVEIPVGNAIGVRARQSIERRAGADDIFHVTLTNDLPSAQVAEVRLAGLAKAENVNLASPDGGKVWRVTVPANGSAELRYSIPTARGR